MPDFVLCCNNICNCMIKWYENIAKELDIPMIMIDIPFNPDYEVSDAETEYIREQFLDAIRQLEEITGKKWTEERFQEVMESSGRASRLWIEATSQAKYVPSPFNGFDLRRITRRACPPSVQKKNTASCSRALPAGHGCALPLPV